MEAGLPAGADGVWADRPAGVQPVVAKRATVLKAPATVFARVARDIVPAFAKEPGYPITLVGEPFLERP